MPARFGLSHGIARTAWLTSYVILLAAPYLLEWRAGRFWMGDPMQVLSVNAGLVAFTLLVVVFVLIARLPSLLSTFGIERILRMHRVAGIFVVAVVLFHIGLVVVSDPRGWSIFDLAHTTLAARAAVLSTVALAGTIVLAVRRKRRQPRYEGWRLLHIALAAVVFGAALVHVVALDHLTGRASFAGWFALSSVVVLAVAARRWLWLPLRTLRRSYVVEKVTPVTGNAVTIDVRATGRHGVDFHPGQFAWLKIGSSCFVFEEHPFTIASTAEAPYRKQFTVKALGDFSELLRGMRPGRRVFLDGPYGEMTTDGLEKSWGFMFVAAGIGVTPMLSMLRTLADRGDPRAHLLLLGATTVEDVVQRQEIEQLRERLSLSVVYTFAQPPPAWPGETGRIDGKMLDRWIPSHAREHFDYFVCGPPTLVSTVGVELRNRGVPTKRIHTERFEVV